MYGYFIKRNDTDFVINVELTQFGSGYNVVYKEIDPWNKYDTTLMSKAVHICVG